MAAPFADPRAPAIGCGESRSVRAAPMPWSTAFSPAPAALRAHVLGRHLGAGPLGARMASRGASAGTCCLSAAWGAGAATGRQGRLSSRATWAAATDVKGGEDDLSFLEEEEFLLQGCERESAPLKVAVLLSGGVDSSVALHLVRRAGHEVTAFYLQIWFQEDFRNTWEACPWEEDLEYAQGVCEREGVHLEVVPLTKEYWDRVVSHSIGEITEGRTPNPDILCNSRVKFGAFYEHLAEEHAGRFDRIASGHYASADRQGPGGAPRLVTSADEVKDQTYFLAGLSPEQLARCMFPLGHLPKSRVREVAGAAGLPTVTRKDSQGICFLGKVKFSEFVAEHVGERPGAIVDADTGEEVGEHRGFWFHTIGQRRGLRLTTGGGPWYVVRKDVEKNIVYVSTSYHADDKRRDGFNWVGGAGPDLARPLRCKVRHGPSSYGCTLEYDDDGRAATVYLDDDDQGIAAGQYCVFYQDGACVGGAVMTGVVERPAGEREPEAARAGG